MEQSSSESLLLMPTFDIGESFSFSKIVSHHLKAFAALCMNGREIIYAIL